MDHSTARLTSTYDTDDLRDLCGHASPFLTVVLPTPSGHDDAAHRLEMRWKNARRDAAAAGWPEARVAELDETIAGWKHGDSASLAVVQSADGARLVESLTSAVTTRLVAVDRHPRLLTVIENRQRMLPHLLVMTDRVGADIVGFDGGTVVASEEVDGETLHIHRGHPGGWSQRRFQQRAENTWDDNADNVAASVIEMASELRPALIAVAGEIRARSLVTESIGTRTEVPIRALEAGDPDGIADEVVTCVDDQHARFARQAIESLREAMGTGRGVIGGSVLDELRHGRVETLLVNDIDDHGASSADGSAVGTAFEPGDRLADRAIAAALDTGASIVVVPAISEVSSGAAAILRW